MATYQFGSISSAESAGYNAANDTLLFTGVTGATATNISITGSASYTVRIVSTGASVTLGFGAMGEVVFLPDGSKLAFPTESAATESGTAFADHLYGGPGGDVLEGLAGNDQLDGGAVADTLSGGAGADTLSGGGPVDTFVFAPGDSGVVLGQTDVITDWNSSSRLQFSTAMSGGDYVGITATRDAALDAANRRIASGAADVVAVQTGADVIIFADTRNNNGGADDAIVLRGRSLNDISASNIVGITPGGGPVAPTPEAPVTGTAGDDILVGGANPDRINGLDGADVLQGVDGDDTLDGGAGDDLLVGGAGADLLMGGAGVDRAVFQSGETGVTVNLIAGTATGAGADRLSGVENVDGGVLADFVVGDAQANQIRGFDGADTLDGQAGADSLDGGDGDDIILGSVGADQMRGGAGADLFSFARGDAPAGTPDTILDYASVDRLVFGQAIGGYAEVIATDFLAARDYASVAIGAGARFVAAQVGESVYVFADTAGDGGVAEDQVWLPGVSLADISAANIVNATGVVAPPPAPGSFLGSGNADTLLGTAGVERLSGLDGDDVLSGGGGSDTIDGGSGIDTVLYSGATGGVSVDLAITTFQPIGGGDGPDVLGAIEGVIGSAFADTLSGTTGANVLRGGDGADSLAGRGGVDLLFGDAGDDVLSGGGLLNGGAGDDSLVGASGADTMTGGEGRDTVSGGLGANVLSGDGGDDVVTGGAGDDTMDGGAGVDTLLGGQGFDRMTGGVGADLFSLDFGPTGQSGLVGATIVDWQADDRIRVGDIVGTAANYLEVTNVPTGQSQQSYAQQQLYQPGVDIVAIQVANAVFVYTDHPASGLLSAQIILQERTLADIDWSHFVAAAPDPGGPAPPPAPTNLGSVAARGEIFGNMDAARISMYAEGDIDENTATGFALSNNFGGLYLGGTGFTYLEDDFFVYAITGGVVTEVIISPSLNANFGLALEIPGLSATAIEGWVNQNATQLALSTLLAGNDAFSGGFGADLLRGFSGNDLMSGRGGADTLWGGAGDDVIYASAAPGVRSSASASTYLRGEDGDDWIQGGGAFDDINGNAGNDTGSGGLGNDWVVGGRDNDLLFGDAGADLVYGNLGNDTCEGGAGNDTVRGGQDDDVVRGGAGNDFLSGDRGNDTLAGGDGADIFSTFGETGTDRVTDFNAAQGDRVMLTPGTGYNIVQFGADTVVDMTGGGQIILVGVTASALPAGWLFGM